MEIDVGGLKLGLVSRPEIGKNSTRLVLKFNQIGFGLDAIPSLIFDTICSLFSYFLIRRCEFGAIIGSETLYVSLAVNTPNPQ